MIVKKYKTIVYCMHDDNIKTILSRGDELKCKCGDICWEYQVFTKDEWDEYLYFDNWEDDSCGNYVGYLLRLRTYNIIVNRNSCGSAELFDITIVNRNVRSNSDPFGERPELWRNRQEKLKLDEIKKIVNIHLRQQKLKRLWQNISISEKTTSL